MTRLLAGLMMVGCVAMVGCAHHQVVHRAPAPPPPAHPVVVREVVVKPVVHPVVRPAPRVVVVHPGRHAHP